MLNIAVKSRAGEERVCEVDAEIIAIADGVPFKFGVWLTPHRIFEVVEASTGLRVADGQTRKRAAQAAGARIREKGMAQLYQRVAAARTLNEEFAVDALGVIPDGAYCRLD